MAVDAQDPNYVGGSDDVYNGAPGVNVPNFGPTTIYENTDEAHTVMFDDGSIERHLPLGEPENPTDAPETDNNY